ncbi:hypothetical protein B0H10DRAFT_2224365 [Mycena sp. CBHHK59/15]|nr:hypothetical protein B0H10DRAFT_2224365 [Mycena sp. CBHHK59/15]
MSVTAGKPCRNCTASTKVSDGNNGKAPSAIHQHVLAIKPILNLIKKIKKLLAHLPETIPEALDTNDIVCVITTVHGIDDSVRGSFNHCFDILFGEDCRDADGQLKNIRCRDAGMAFVINYLKSIHWESANIPLDLAGIKLKCIADELEHLCAENPAPATAQGKKNQLHNTGPKWDAMMDRVFAAATTTNKKDENLYKPRRKNPDLSEESEDNFDMEELDQPAPPMTGKHKVVVIESDDEAELPVAPAMPPKKGPKF